LPSSDAVWDDCAQLFGTPAPDQILEVSGRYAVRYPVTKSPVVVTAEPVDMFDAAANVRDGHVDITFKILRKGWGVVMIREGEHSWEGAGPETYLLHCMHIRAGF